MSTPAFLIHSVHGQTLASDIALSSQSEREIERERECVRNRDIE